MLKLKNLLSWVFFLCLVFLITSSSQLTYKGFSISSYNDSFGSFLQGQLPSFTYFIKNVSFDKPVENHPHRRILYLVHITTGDTLNYKGRIFYKNYPYAMPFDSEYEKTEPYIPFKKRQIQIRYLTFYIEDFGQIPFKINIIGKNPIVPLFLKPGSYELAFEECLVPTHEKLGLKYRFSVEEPQNKDLAYFNAYKEILTKIFTNSDTSQLISEIKTFFEDYDNPYFESLLGVFAMEIIYPDYLYPTLAILRKRSEIVFIIYNTIPKLKDIKSLGVINSFYIFFSYTAVEFKKRGWIIDWKSYKTEYLNKFKNSNTVLQKEIKKGLDESDYYFEKYGN